VVEFFKVKNCKEAPVATPLPNHVVPPLLQLIILGEEAISAPEAAEEPVVIVDPLIVKLEEVVTTLFVKSGINNLSKTSVPAFKILFVEAPVNVVVVFVVRSELNKPLPTTARSPVKHKSFLKYTFALSPIWTEENVHVVGAFTDVIELDGLVDVFMNEITEGDDAINVPLPAALPVIKFPNTEKLEEVASFVPALPTIWSE
jgi:hypothetical protein